MSIVIFCIFSFKSCLYNNIMAEYYLGWELLELEERVRMLERRVERKVLRDTQNPYDLPINEFMNTFRVSPELAMDLTNSIRDSLQRERSSGLPVEIQVIIQF